MNRTGRYALVMVGAATMLWACGDSVTGPGEETGVGLSFTYADGTGYEASGQPTFDGGDLGASTFAIAVPDSLGGLVITSFQQTDGTRGDLFILQLADTLPGDFGPCNILTGDRCHGRLLEDLDATNVFDVGAAWEIVDGTVHLDEVGPDRVKGSFADLVLQVQDSTEPDHTIASGTFDLPLLSDEEAAGILACFVKRATGSPTC